MREAFSSLTTRGLSFFAAGVVCAIAGLALGHEDLFRIAVLLLALPLTAVLLLSRSRYRLSSTRVVTPARIEAGQSAKVTLSVENVSRLPTGVMFLEESLPYALGGRPRFVIDRLLPSTSKQVTYPVRSENRGRFRVGPLTIRLSDPLGLCELVRAFSSTDTMLVTPQIIALPTVRIAGSWNGGGDGRSRSVASAGDDDVATREYRRGDDLRRVHWRSTARAGELMVRREEQPWHSQAAVLLDNRAGSHRGEGTNSSFEYAVSATASIAVHLLRHSYQVHLACGMGQKADDPVVVEKVDERVLLDRCAEVVTSGAPTLLPLTERLGTSDQLIVAVLGTVTPDDALQLARLRRRAICVAVMVDATSWGGLSHREKVAADSTRSAAALLLQHAGWRVVSVDRTTSLATAWAGLNENGVMDVATQAVGGPR
ncbi:MAG: hypothetical protein QOF57_1221 [Frankiaceae bacterium]|jgi:uncharacterized protein (DUF58 family)|nr:hypothetical protein [Frankiaceae bacterium]MDQ1727095.1 hypothetical protein [Frankiaceae bacterium]